VLLGEGHSPFVAIDDAGRAIGAWLQPRGSESTYDVASRHFDPAAGWAATQLIASTGGSASGVRLVADSAGNVTAIWQQSNGNGEDLWTARWSAGAWGTARLLETDAGSLVVGVALAGDSADNVIAAWSQFDGNDYNVWSRRYVAGSGWAAATMIAAHGGQPVLAVDPSGNAIAVWDRVDVSKSFWAARFTPAGGWGTETRIDTDSSGDSFYPGIAVSATGAAVVGWSRSDGTGHSGVPMHMWTTTFE
jgi:hypothetical protein